jgi:hypothetical protein
VKFNLINPSDPYTFEADDLEVAAVAVCLLGEGKYPADAMGADADQGNNVPPFLFGGHDEWFTARFGAGFEDTTLHCLTHRTDAVARVLESMKLGSVRRSSLNDIGGRARELAKGIREKYAATTST